MTSTRFIRSLAWVALVLMLPVLLMWPTALHADQAQYFYDELGRLSAVSDSTGKTAIYTYDAVGNLLSIVTNTPPGTGIGIYLLAPSSGVPPNSVSIQGYGFDPTPSNNTVQFYNGITATVVSATAYTIVATVPAGATTGPVTVMNTNGTATSPQPFTVLGSPTVTGVAPGIVPRGAISGLQIMGSNLFTATAVQFIQAGISATILSGGTATTLPLSLNVAPTVPAGPYPFSVTTAAGTVQSGVIVVTVSATAVPTYSVGAVVSVSATTPYPNVPATSAPSGWSIAVAPAASALPSYPDVPATSVPSGWSITVAPPASASTPP